MNVYRGMIIVIMKQLARIQLEVMNVNVM